MQSKAISEEESMDIHHIEFGSGKPIIFLHGFCATSELWTDFVQPLAAGYRVILPDLPGFGNSPLPSEVSIDGIAALMQSWLREIKATNSVVIGHSLGGYAALAMAKSRPDDLAGLGLFHSTASADSEEKKANRKKIYEFVKINGASLFLDSFVPGLFFKQEAELLDKYQKIAQQTETKTILDYTLAMHDRPSYEAVIQKIDVPTLFLAGEKDNLIPAAVSAAQAKAAKQSQLAIIPNVGHMGMLENPPAFLDPIVRFLHQF